MKFVASAMMTSTVNTPEAEGSPVIMDVHKTNDAGDEFDDIGAEQGVLDPVLDCLIQNDDKQADY